MGPSFMDEIMKALDDKPNHTTCSNTLQPKSPDADALTLTSDTEPLIDGCKGR